MNNLFYNISKLLFCAILLSSCIDSTTKEAHAKEKIIKIDSLEFLAKDIGQMSWNDANSACDSIGEGWRLPTLDELNLIHTKFYEKYKGEGVNTNYSLKKNLDFELDGINYWSSNEFSDGTYWYFDVTYGQPRLSNLGGLASCSVLAVRALK
jgi:hypothetical protein